MRKAMGVWVLPLLGGLARQAVGGIVTFSPNFQAPVPGEVVRMTLTLVATGDVTTISGADVVIGSHEVPFTFAYSDEWLGVMGRLPPPDPAGFYDGWDFFVGGSTPTIGVGSSIELGTVSIGTASLAEGVYTIEVNTDFDGFSDIFRGILGQPFVSEPLQGQGVFYVGVPEPATVGLLAWGVAAIARRRVTPALRRRKILARAVSVIVLRCDPPLSPLNKGGMKGGWHRTKGETDLGCWIGSPLKRVSKTRARTASMTRRERPA